MDDQPRTTSINKHTHDHLQGKRSDEVVLVGLTKCISASFLLFFLRQQSRSRMLKKTARQRQLDGVPSSGGGVPSSGMNMSAFCRYRIDGGRASLDLLALEVGAPLGMVELRSTSLRPSVEDPGCCLTRGSKTRVIV